ncbi:LysO family transporter [Marinitoga litoralis]|uniref:LysO family transporter n=1 Tax=Marinitoga litoralis TaxID=570855 RepID=UPI001961093A|nr:LysO family transporter [Marinitoga litoralis]MBM7560198.1 uncharacterized membrane protein YbjE (DUF340 family) [Marinitoga litoralis]
MLYLILIAFVLGFIIGMNGKLKFLKKINAVTYITVLLLFFMGYELGSDEKLIKQLSEIGYLSFLIALFAIIGSAILPTIYEKFILNKGDKK